MTEEVYDNLTRIKQRISQLLRRIDEFAPIGAVHLIYQESIKSQKYSIVICLVEEDSFVDSRGRKWIRQKDDQ